MNDNNNNKLVSQDLLTNHIREMQLLVAYLSKTGSDIPSDSLKRASEYFNLPLNDWNSETEAQFWNDFGKLCQIAKPATIETIEVNSEIAYDINRSSISKRKNKKIIIFNYSIVALVSMVFVLVLQIYWVIGTNVLQRTVIAKSDLELLETTKKDLKKKITELDITIERQKQKLPAKVRDTDIDIQILTREWEQLTEASPQLDADITSAVETVDALYQTLKYTTFKIPHYFAPKAAKQIYIEFQKTLNVTAVEYLLPLLLGLLGASVYVLRTMSYEIKQKIFLPGNTVNYKLRLYLGMIAGLTFAWLFSWLIPAGDNEGFRAASPLAIAFIVGYSVEVLFSGLDKIIGYFTD